MDCALPHRPKGMWLVPNTLVFSHHQPSLAMTKGMVDDLHSLVTIYGDTNDHTQGCLTNCSTVFTHIREFHHVLPMVGNDIMELLLSIMRDFPTSQWHANVQLLSDTCHKAGNAYLLYAKSPYLKLTSNT